VKIIGTGFRRFGLVLEQPGIYLNLVLCPFHHSPAWSHPVRRILPPPSILPCLNRDVSLIPGPWTIKESTPIVRMMATVSFPTATAIDFIPCHEKLPRLLR